MNSDKHYLLLAYKAALESPDPSTQNGAVLISWTGKIVDACNTFPYGVRNEPDRLVRPLKYSFIEHAERNVIFKAAQDHRFDFKDAVMYAPWFACADCARAIIQVGIRKVVGHKQIHDMTPAHWKESINCAYAMFAEAGVETVLVDGEIGAPELLFNGGLWRP
jgi:dCMP deaminase